MSDKQITINDKEIFSRYRQYIDGVTAAHPEVKLTAFLDKINGRPVMVVNQKKLGMNKIFIVGTNYMSDNSNLALISEITAMLDNSGKCFVESYVTTPAYQNQGYGSYLMNIVKQACKDNGTQEIYGQVSPFDDLAEIPQQYLEMAGYDEFAAHELFLQDHYKNRGFEVETIYTPHTHHRTGQTTYSKYVKFSGQCQNLQSTKAYPDEFLDIKANNHRIVNYYEIMTTPTPQPTNGQKL